MNVVGRAAIGRTNTATLSRLADLADRADAVRTTPGGIALLGVAEPLARNTVDALGTLGLVVDPDDPRSGISACIGAPGCASARADTVAAAADMADRRGTTRGPAAAIHLAACEKRCGAPLGATVLTADDRGRFVVAGATG